MRGSVFPPGRGQAVVPCGGASESKRERARCVRAASVAGVGWRDAKEKAAVLGTQQEKKEGGSKRRQCVEAARRAPSWRRPSWTTVVGR